MVQCYRGSSQAPEQNCYKNGRMVGHGKKIVEQHGPATKQSDTEISMGLSPAPILNAHSFYNIMMPIRYILQKLEHARYVLSR